MRNIKAFILSLKDLSNLEVIAKCTASGLKKISTGSSRVVFALNDHKVIKIALSNAGVEQNTTEVMTWEYIESNYKQYKSLFAKVHLEYCHKWDHFIVMERLTKVHDKKKLSIRSITNWSFRYMNPKFYKGELNSKVLKYFTAVQRLDEDLCTSNVLDICTRNFGYSAGGKPKMLDYGFSNEAKANYVGAKSHMYKRTIEIN